MTFVRIDGREVIGLTEEERRSLDPRLLGRAPVRDDVRTIFSATLIGPVVHHVGSRVTCDGCATRVFAWARELSFIKGFTGRRFCATCAKHRKGF